MEEQRREILTYLLNKAVYDTLEEFLPPDWRFRVKDSDNDNLVFFLPGNRLVVFARAEEPVVDETIILKEEDSGS
jgi:hypothetical protein